MDRKEWELEQEKRKILQDSVVTELKKDKFIDEVLSGLGKKIKKEPNTVHKKPSLYSKIKKLIGWN